MAVQLYADFRCAIASGVNVLISGGNAEARLRAAQRIHDFTHPRGARFVTIAADRARARLSLLRSLCRKTDGVTVFVDDIDTFDEKTQLDLLNAIRRGCSEAVRLVSGTSSDLYGLVRNTLFSGDLFYRLNSVHLILDAYPQTVHG
jgi:DNA-binding NtrC family response regulator